MIGYWISSGTECATDNAIEITLSPAIPEAECTVFISIHGIAIYSLSRSVQVVLARRFNWLNRSKTSQKLRKELGPATLARSSYMIPLQRYCAISCYMQVPKAKTLSRPPVFFSVAFRSNSVHCSAGWTEHGRHRFKRCRKLDFVIGPSVKGLVRSCGNRRLVMESNRSDTPMQNHPEPLP